MTKQKKLLHFLSYNRIDILLIQEHNLKDSKEICSELNDEYYVSLNYAVCNKGGTAILISKRIPYYILNEEKSADSRIISMKLKVYDQFIHIVNIYAHSGSRSSDRDERGNSLSILRKILFLRFFLTFQLFESNDFDCFKLFVWYILVIS